MFRLHTDAHYFGDDYSKKTAVSHMSVTPETSILQRSSFDSFDTLPELKCPSVDRLQGSHVRQERRAEWVMVPSYESRSQVGFKGT